MTEPQTIYVELLDEGVTVYRPVEATPDRDGTFRLPATAPADERCFVAQPSPGRVCGNVPRLAEDDSGMRGELLLDR
jgi:hypothetical protein